MSFQHNPSPAYTTLYDKFVETQSHRALQTYQAMLPTIAQPGVTNITDIEMMDQLAVAERTLHAVSTAFGVVNQDNARLDTICRNDARRQGASLAHIASVFGYLGSLLHHPAYVMLSTARSVQDRQKPLGALRDIRWIYKPDFGGLTFISEEAVFKELTAILHQITRSAGNAPGKILLTAIQDFEGFVFDADGRYLVNQYNFGTAASLAQNVVECMKKAG